MRINDVVTITDIPRSHLCLLLTPEEAKAVEQRDIDGAMASGSPYGWTLDDAGESRLYTNERAVPQDFPADTRFVVVQTSKVHTQSYWNISHVKLMDRKGTYYLVDRRYCDVVSK